jgi:putative redox protein
MNLQEGFMIAAEVKLTQALTQQRQFVARTGSGHHLVLDDTAGGTGAKAIEMVAVGLAGCTGFDVITILRQKYHQKITGYEVRVEAEQAERPPQVFTKIRIHHVVTGIGIDEAALEQAIRLSEDKYCSVGAMLQKTATFETTHEIIEDTTSWIHEVEAAGVERASKRKASLLSRRASAYPLASHDPSNGKSEQGSFDRFPKSMSGGCARWLASKHGFLQIELLL